MTVCTTTPEESTPTAMVNRKAFLALLRKAVAVASRSAYSNRADVAFRTIDGVLGVYGTGNNAAFCGVMPCGQNVAPCVAGGRSLLADVTADRSILYDLAELTAPAHRAKGRPYLSVPTQVVTFSAVPGETMLGVVRGVVRGAAETSRYAINGVLLESGADGARLVAMNGRCLGVFETRQPRGAPEVSVVLPARMLMLAGKWLGKKSGTIRVERTTGTGRISIHGPDWSLCSYEVEGSFPNYRDVIPLDDGMCWQADRVKLIAALKLVSKVCDPDARVVRLDFAQYTLRLSATGKAGEHGESPDTASDTSVVCPAGKVEQCDLAIGFNPLFLLDALRSIPGDRVEISATASNHPCMIYGTDTKAIRWLIMPITITV